jgi:hypothetical protein
MPEVRKPLSVAFAASERGMLEAAAAIEGKRLTEFIRAASVQAARRICGRHATPKPLARPEPTEIIVATAAEAPMSAEVAGPLPEGWSAGLLETTEH